MSHDAEAVRRLEVGLTRLIARLPGWWRRATAGDVLPTVGIGAAIILGVAGLWASPYWSVRTGKLALLELAMLALVATLIRTRPLRWLVWLGILGFALTYNDRSMVTVWRLLLAGLGIELVATRVTSKSLLDRFLMCARLLAMAHTGVMLVQMQGIVYPFFTVTQFNPDGSPPIVGLMDNAGFSGAYTAMMLPLFADGWGRRAWLIPSLWAVATTNALGAMVVAVVMLAGMARWAWRWQWRWISAPAVGLLVAYSSLVEPIPRRVWGERGNRLTVWKEAVTISNHSWRTRWIGWGPGQFAPAFRGIGTRIPHLKGGGIRWDKAHNEAVQALFEFGRLGLLLGLWMVGRWLHAGCNWAREEPGFLAVWLMAVGWVLVGTYHFAAHHPSLAIVGIVVAGLCEGARRRGYGTVS